MEQLICHLLGDYMFQTSWMALGKYERGLRGWLPAIAHGIVYTCWFLLLTQDVRSLFIIGVTHVVIDHYRVAGWWARLINWEWASPQPVIPLWCMVVIDQTMHLTINYLALK